MANPGGTPANLRRGNPGNRGGGNIKSKVREMCAQGFEDAVPKIIAIAKGEAVDVAKNEQIQAFNALGKYGMGEMQAVTLEQGEWLALVSEVTAKHLPSKEAFDAWWQDLTDTLNSMK